MCKAPEAVETVVVTVVLSGLRRGGSSGDSAVTVGRLVPGSCSRVGDTHVE